MSEEAIVSLQDVLEEDQRLEQTANAVLGDSDDTQCTYPKVNGQVMYKCSFILYMQIYVAMYV